MVSQEEMDLQEPEGKTEPIPPDAHPVDGEQNRIDPMDIRPEHVLSLLLQLADKTATVSSVGALRVTPSATLRSQSSLRAKTKS